MSRKKSGAPFSLFAFQDAITSVCGVVVLITLLLALALTQRVEVESQASTVAKSKVDEVRAQVEKLQNDLDELNARVEETAAVDSAGVGKSLAEVKAQLANAKRRLEGAQEESSRLDRKLEELEERKETFAGLEERIDELKRSAAETLEKAEETAKEEFDSQESAVYAFNDDVREKPWYVEISGSKLVAHGSVDDSGAKTFDSPFAFARWATTRPSGSEYFVLIVRPSGARNFEFAVLELESEGYRYGIDLISESRPLMFLQEGRGKESP